MDIYNLEKWIIHDEGLRQFPYYDTVRKLTIGIGHNLTDNGLSLSAIDFIFKEDLQIARSALEAHDWYNKQPIGVKNALMNMCFNLGMPRLSKFHGMISALNEKNYELAARQALNSLWAKQVPNRAKEVADAIREGK